MVRLWRTPSSAPVAEAGFPLVGGGGRPRAGSILLLELLSPWKQSRDCSVNIERAAASQKGSQEAHHCAFLPAGLDGAEGAGGVSQGDRLALPPDTSVNWLLPHPSWSSPGREMFQRDDAHPLGEVFGGKGGFQIGGSSCYPHPSMSEIPAKESPSTYLFQVGEPSYLKSSFFMLFTIVILTHNHARPSLSPLLLCSIASLRRAHPHGLHYH